MKLLTFDDLNFSNKKFWTGFVATSFPAALDEASDMSLDEIVEENGLDDCDWWDAFTGYYEGILEESDGYLENPQTLVYRRRRNTPCFRYGDISRISKNCDHREICIS